MNYIERTLNTRSLRLNTRSSVQEAIGCVVSEVVSRTTHVCSIYNRFSLTTRVGTCRTKVNRVLPIFQNENTSCEIGTPQYSPVKLHSPTLGTVTAKVGQR